MPTPVPPPLLVPEGFELPTPALELPLYQQFQWVDPPRWQQKQAPSLQPPVLDPPSQDPPKPAVVEPKESSPAAPAAPPEAAAPSAPVVPAPAAPPFAEVRQVTVPIINKEIPVPSTAILVTATATAGVSSVTAVAGTLLANSLFKQVMTLAKPVTKAAVKKLAQLRKKPAPLSWARARRLERRRGRSR